MFECAVALVLLVDVSSSITNPNYKLQRNGYADAFRNEQVIETITNKASAGGVAVSLVEWGDGHALRVDWQIIKTTGDAYAFADKVEALDRAHYLGNATMIGEAVYAGVDHMSSAPCKPQRRIIDISGDGYNSGSQVDPNEAKEMAESYNITINGLPIQAYGPGADPEIDLYYKKNVITHDGFIVPAHEFKDFPRAIVKKLVDEIS